MIIPKHIRVMGRTFDVVKGAECPWYKDAEIAAFNLLTGKIWIQTPRHIDTQHAGLFHEVHEIILHMMYTVEDDGDDDFKFTITHDKFRDMNSVLWATIIDNGIFR